MSPETISISNHLSARAENVVFLVMKMFTDSIPINGFTDVALKISSLLFKSKPLVLSAILLMTSLGEENLPGVHAFMKLAIQ